MFIFHRHLTATVAVLGLLLPGCRGDKGAGSDTTLPTPEGNHVTVESTSVPGNTTSVRIGVYVANDVPLTGLVLPLEFRAVTTGSYITRSCTFNAPSGNRIGASPLAVAVTKRILGVPGGDPCSGPTAGTYETNAPVDFVSPDGFLWAGVSTSASPDLHYLPPGSDYHAGAFADWPSQGQSTTYAAGPSFEFVFDVTGTPGSFVIDTCCVRPANRLLGTDLNVEPVLLTFTKGTITVE
jgi:hypothetical protein